MIDTVQVVGAHARVPGHAAVGARIGDLHPPAAAPAANEALQQRGALARGAAALAATDHVGTQPLAGGQVLVPGHIAGMVIGDADRPLLERHLHRAATHPPVISEVLLGAGAAEHERARIRRVGQQVVHRPIARPDPPHPPLADRAPRQPLPLGDQLGDDLASGPQPPPQAEHPLDRVTNLLISGQRDRPVLVTVKADRQVLLELAALGLVAQPAVQPRADQVQLRLAPSCP